jgi:FkbM family methyltransferase
MKIIKFVSNWYEIIIYFIMLRFGVERRTILTFRNGMKLRYMKGAIIDNVYKFVDVRGRDVVDVGAFVGDTIILFHIEGAKRIFAYEPYPYAYGLACENIRLNHLDNVYCFNAAVEKESGSVKINPSYKSTIADTLQNFESGASVPVFTLSQLVEEHHLKDAVLKLNCEGGEYGIILGSNCQILRSFSDIVVQFHYGFEGLIYKLQSCNFDIKLIGKPITKPITLRGRGGVPRIHGMLYARRVDTFTDIPTASAAKTG